MPITVKPKEDLVVSNWTEGIAASPHFGFGFIANCDVFTRPGVLQINFKTTKVSGTTVTNTPQWFTEDASGNILCYDASNKLYRSTDSGDTWSNVTGNTQTAGNGNGLGNWKGYTFCIRNTAIDLSLNTTPTTWSNSWYSGLTSATWHPVLSAQDDILYIGNARYIATITEVAGSTFDPANAATYSINATALDLPQGYNVTSAEELGKYLVIGASSPYGDSRVFYWDRISPSFFLPQKYQDVDISQLLSYNNELYIVGRDAHTVYLSNLSSYSILKEFNFFRMNESTGFTLDTSPGGIMRHQEKIYTGIATFTTGGDDTVNPIGVYSVTRDGKLFFEHQISTGNLGALTAGVSAESLWRIARDTYLIGWRDDTTPSYGIDKISTTARYTTYAAYVESPFYKVGTRIAPRTLQHISIQLSENLASGQGVKLSYRTDLSASFTSIATIDFATNGAIQEWETDYSVTAQAVQVKIELTTADATSPQLLEVRWR